VVPLAIHSSDFLETLDMQRLCIVNLKPARYDGSRVGIFVSNELALGIDPTNYPTPLVQQAREVLDLTVKRAGIYNFRWRFLQISLADDGLGGQPDAIRAIDRLESELAVQRSAKTQPVPRRYTLEPQ
jgi:hypothetical protein